MAEQQDAHTDAESQTAEERLEEILQALWDRVRRAGELIGTLRTERNDLMGRLTALESEFENVRKDLTEQKKQLLERDEQIRTLQRKAAEHEGAIMSNGEKEALLARAKDLLERIEGYL